MIKPLTLLSLLPILCVACGEARKPEPDPAKLEALVAQLDEKQEPGKTERLFNSVEKISPERIDPKVAIAVVAD